MPDQRSFSLTFFGSDDEPLLEVTLTTDQARQLGLPIDNPEFAAGMHPRVCYLGGWQEKPK